MAIESSSRTETDHVDTILRAAMEKHHVPGAVVGITYEGQDLVSAFGVTNTEQPLEVTQRTLFQIGSTTKTITGTAILRLVEAGSIDLDATVRTYLPELKLADEDAASRATIRHLLTHTGGWEGDFFANPSRGDDALHKILKLLADRPQITPLGTIWSYNNAAFYIAGRVVEIVTGKPYEVAARELVLDPLNMQESFFFPEEVMTYRFAVGHRWDDDGLHVARPWQLARSVNPAGGLTSTAADQLKYARLHLSGGIADTGDRLLTEESVRLMQTPVTEADNGSFIGLTWFIKDVAGLRTVSHGGTTNGQLSEFLLVPERNFAITVLTNGSGGHQLGREVVDWSLQHYFGVADSVPSRKQLSPEQLETYAGRYERTTGYIDVVIEDDVLVLQMTQTRSMVGDPPPPPPPMRAAVVEGERILFIDGPSEGTQAEFLRDEEGRVAWLRLGKRIHARTLG